MRLVVVQERTAKSIFAVSEGLRVSKRALGEDVPLMPHTYTDVMNAHGAGAAGDAGGAWGVLRRSDASRLVRSCLPILHISTPIQHRGYRIFRRLSAPTPGFALGRLAARGRGCLIFDAACSQSRCRASAATEAKTP